MHEPPQPAPPGSFAHPRLTCRFQASSDPLLSSYTVLIVDEAHERSLQSDVALAILKKAQTQRRDGLAMANPKLSGNRCATHAATAEAANETLCDVSVVAASCEHTLPPLKIIVMSATLEVDRFCDFFDDAPAVQASTVYDAS